ncbi:MAG: histone deacetylase [Thermoflexales bacterium]
MSSPVGYCYDPVFLEHHIADHPENRQRLEMVLARLQHSDLWPQLRALQFTPANFETLTALHEPRYVSTVYHVAERGGGWLNPDTYVTRATFRAAAHAVGASLAAARAVSAGQVRRAFALVRPPGHHAFANHGEGFCLFNNVAFAAKCALGDLDAEPDAAWSPSAQRNHRQAQPRRVMIVDFDVHHGNGTQAIFYDDPRVLYVSVHEYGWMIYPGSGSVHERGRGEAIGTTLNVPLPPGVGDLGYARVFDELITPAALRFRPEMLLVSAGFDAHWRDPLAHMNLSLSGFARIIRVLRSLSDALCNGRMVLVLEGGYDLAALSYGVLNCFRILLGQDDVEDPLGPSPEQEPEVDEIVAQVSQVHALR